LVEIRIEQSGHGHQKMALEFSRHGFHNCLQTKKASEWKLITDNRGACQVDEKINIFDSPAHFSYSKRPFWVLITPRISFRCFMTHRWPIKRRSLDGGGIAKGQ
jgi:hypothetical protein